MLKEIEKLFKYTRQTQNYPKITPDSSRFIARPEISFDGCTGCGTCSSRCPTKAIVTDNDRHPTGINYDECIVCCLCDEVCPQGCIKMTNHFEFAAKSRQEIRHTPLMITDSGTPEKSYEVLCDELRANIKKTFGRSLQIREVDAGSCNGCDYEINALSNPINDSERLGISFVASPRHADMLLVTGCPTRNMQLALAKTYNATPDPKLVVAVGACACSGGIFKGSYATADGIDTIIPVDVFIPGCPPRPLTILYGILKAIEKVKG